MRTPEERGRLVGGSTEIGNGRGEGDGEGGERARDERYLWHHSFIIHYDFPFFLFFFFSLFSYPREIDVEVEIQESGGRES